MTTSTFGLLATVVLSAGALATQAQSSGESDSLKRLRQIIAEQKQNPSKVIRDPTNPPAAEVKGPAAQTVAPPASKPLPEPTLAAVQPPPAAPSSDKKAAAAELERQFLSGKISARKYQKALAELDNPSKTPAPATNPKPAPTVTATPAKTPPGQAVATTPAPTAATPSQPTVEYKRVSEVESKIDDMIRQKEARESAVKTNAPAAPAAPSGPLTRRQRLDFLLRQVIEGKLSDAEYKKEREKILAEPE